MSDPAPDRPSLLGPILLHALQAVLYGAGAYELGERWFGYTAVLGAAAALQIAGAGARLAGRPRITGIAAALNVLIILGLYGEVIAQALYMERAFGPQTAEAAIQSLGVPALLIPWVLAIPLTQLGQLRRAHLLLLLAPLSGLRAWGDPIAGATNGEATARALQQMLRADKVTDLPTAALLTPIEVITPAATVTVLPAPGANPADPAALSAPSVAPAAPADPAAPSDPAALSAAPSNPANPSALPSPANPSAPAAASLPPAPADPGILAANLTTAAILAATPPPTLYRRGETIRIKADGVVPLLTAEVYLLDVPGEPIPGGLVRPGADAPLRRPISPHAFARDVRRDAITPIRSAPRADTATRYSSWLVRAGGVTPLIDGWTAPPDASAPDYGVTPAALDASVRAGADHLIANMRPDGRFTYIVKGPSGDPGRGYNYPRHAGTSWFLARAAAALDEPRFGLAADAALGHLEQMSGSTTDGRRYVLDPDRKDGKSWAGTTALAVMALALRNNRPDLLRDWTRQLAASVDAEGKVRGEMDLKTGTFPEQQANPYGQGQVMLALAAAERAGEKSGVDALTRSIGYLDRGDYAGSRYPLIVADEHWMCLTAHALREVRQTTAADGVCAAYAARERAASPAPGGALQPASGPAGGLAEAIVAHAWHRRDSAYAHLWRDHSLRYGWLFLRSQYKDSDSPLLNRPDRLIGGFRDTPGELDVQIDAVQHIGSAILGVEAIMSGRLRPGSMP